MSMVWHYSAGTKLSAIVNCGELRGTNVVAAWERPMLWFSANQHWEPTATKLLISKDGIVTELTFEQQAKKFGCIRFGLDADDYRLLEWKAACRMAGTTRGIRRSLEKSGRRLHANSADWFATEHRIPVSQLHFQIWCKGWSSTRCILAQDRSESSDVAQEISL